MSKKGKKKSGNQNPIPKIVLITAILNLLKAIVDLIDKLSE